MLLYKFVKCYFGRFFAPPAGVRTGAFTMSGNVVTFASSSVREVTTGVAGLSCRVPRGHGGLKGGRAISHATAMVTFCSVKYRYLEKSK